MEEIYIAYTALLTLASFVIYAGAWGSLPPRRKSSMQPKGASEEDEEDLDERLSSSDAYLFPLLASAALLGIYLVFKYLGTEWVNWVLGWYFAVIGAGSVCKTLTALLRGILGREKWRSFDNTKLYIVKDNRELLCLSFRSPTAFIFPFALLPSIFYKLSHDKVISALVTNTLSLSFAYNALCFLKLDGFKTGSILLGGLFLYDIWWVFGTEVMIKVATTLDAPIKIMWPKAGHFSPTSGFALLGLGDIVIPGMFVTLCLRRDLSASLVGDPDKPFAKPYFAASLVAYIFGLMTTMGVMHVFKTAQPALLYLSPACILSFLITALMRNELKSVWSWRDEPEREPQQPEPAELEVRDPITPSDGDAVTSISVNAVRSLACGHLTAEAAHEEAGEGESQRRDLAATGGNISREVVH